LVGPSTSPASDATAVSQWPRQESHREGVLGDDRLQDRTTRGL